MTSHTRGQPYWSLNGKPQGWNTVNFARYPEKEDGEIKSHALMSDVWGTRAVWWERNFRERRNKAHSTRRSLLDLWSASKRKREKRGERKREKIKEELCFSDSRRQAGPIDACGSSVIKVLGGEALRRNDGGLSHWRYNYSSYLFNIASSGHNYLQGASFAFWVTRLTGLTLKRRDNGMSSSKGNLILSPQCTDMCFLISLSCKHSRHTDCRFMQWAYFALSIL